MLRTGTSGYRYDHWREAFYPRGLPRHAWLAHYAERFGALELNATFYRLPRAEHVDAWRAQAPAGFRFALKYSRFGSHVKRLREPEAHLPPFVALARRLGPKLGPLLVQLPPHWHADPERLDRFLALAPRALRLAVEVRDASWLCEPVYAVLRTHRAALCLHDLIEDHPRVLTAPWAYLRFHGPGGDHARPYSPQKLTAAARWIARRLDEGRDVYAFFNNDGDAHAVRDAARLERYVQAAADRRDAGS